MAALGAVEQLQQRGHFRASEKDIAFLSLAQIITGLQRQGAEQFTGPLSQWIH